MTTPQDAGYWFGYGLGIVLVIGFVLLAVWFVWQSVKAGITSIFIIREIDRQVYHHRRHAARRR